jgi:hypothetical protein
MIHIIVSEFENVNVKSCAVEEPLILGSILEFGVVRAIKGDNSITTRHDRLNMIILEPSHAKNILTGFGSI